MVAYFYRSWENILWPRYAVSAPGGIPVLSVALPQKYSPRRLERTARNLYRRGLRRFLSGDPALIPKPLAPVSPLPLYRAKGAELVLSLLSQTRPWERRVALRGETAGPEAWRLAELLCPQVGALVLDFDRGQEGLERRLRERFGAAPLRLGQGRSPQAAVELDPRPAPLPQSFRLWGEPELLGFTLLPEENLAPELPRLPFLELLWETGRVELDSVRVAGEAEWP